ncbi:MAG: capsular biosynthesis protein [Bacteroidales bacterium]|nr:capsular biosynthesis protein [Bacteroidales bacterium]
MKKPTLFIVLIAMSFFGFSQDWFGFNRYKADNERIIKAKDYPNVVFMGNSITDNWAYFHPNFFSDNNFCGRGISGQTSAQMLVRFYDDVVALHPIAVVIMAGTNDVAHNEYWVKPKQVVENIKAMCNIAKANGITPIISSIPPCKEFSWNPDIKNAGETIVDINNNLKDYAKANKLIYVDYHTALADETLAFPKALSEDGCHPNPDTYYIMEELVLNAIHKVVK